MKGARGGCLQSRSTAHNLITTAALATSLRWVTMPAVHALHSNAWEWYLLLRCQDAGLMCCQCALQDIVDSYYGYDPEAAYYFSGFNG